MPYTICKRCHFRTMLRTKLCAICGYGLDAQRASSLSVQTEPKPRAALEAAFKQLKPAWVKKQPANQ